MGGGTPWPGLMSGRDRWLRDDPPEVPDEVVAPPAVQPAAQRPAATAVPTGTSATGASKPDRTRSKRARTAGRSRTSARSGTKKWLTKKDDKDDDGMRDPLQFFFFFFSLDRVLKCLRWMGTGRVVIVATRQGL